MSKRDLSNDLAAHRLAKEHGTTVEKMAEVLPDMEALIEKHAALGVSPEQMLATFTIVREMEELGLERGSQAENDYLMSRLREQGFLDDETSDPLAAENDGCYQGTKYEPRCGKPAAATIVPPDRYANETPRRYCKAHALERENDCRSIQWDEGQP